MARGREQEAAGQAGNFRTPSVMLRLAAVCLWGLAGCSGSESLPSAAAKLGIAATRSVAAGDAGLTAGFPGGFAGGVVTTSEPEAAAAAAAVLTAGGNAVDAAATAQFMLNVVEPQSSGIGGGGFMLVWLAASRTLIALDCRETAPAAATATMFLDASDQPLPYALASTSGLAVGVPGTLHCIDTALSRWGTISLATALAPAIDAAEQGFVIGPHLAATLTEDLAPRGRLSSEEGDPAYEVARAVFAPQGRPLRGGERLRQPELAATFRAIAADGLRAFYECAHPSGIAAALVAAQRSGRASIAPVGYGLMTCADLAGYRPVLRRPIEAAYRGIVVKSMPPPSSGGLTLVQMLKMLQRFPLADARSGFAFGEVATMNVMQDAMRLAYADRAVWIGDTDVVAGLPLSGLIDDRYLAQRAASCPLGEPALGLYCLRPGSRLAEITAGDPRPFEDVTAAAAPAGRPAPLAETEGEHTTHFTIADRWGNIVAYTSTIESTWGTGLMVPGHGFLLNNELTDFNFLPRRRGSPGDRDFDPGANDVAPGKRPRSSMAPTMLFIRGEDGDRPVAAYGSPGGASIINTLLAITLNLIDHRLAVQDAVDRPRLSLSSPDDDAVTRLEDGFRSGVVDRLRGLGYRFRSAVIGSVQAVVLDPATSRARGASDARRDGTVIGLDP